MRYLLPLVLLGCGPSPHTQRAAPMDMALTATEAVAGMPMTLTATGSPAGGNVGFVVSTAGPGNRPCPAVLQGLCMDLGSPNHLLGVAPATAAGASFTLTVPPTVPVGTDLWLQAASPDGANAHSSNVVQLTVQAPPLIVGNITMPNYLISPDNLAVGSLQFVDRTYTYAQVPPALLGQSFVITANGDKYSTGDALFSVDISRRALVHIAHDDRALPKPAWLGDFVDTGEDIVSSDGANRFSLFAKAFDPGTVTLGGNVASGTPNCSMYTVVFLPDEPVPPGLASAPVPADGATGVSPTADLRWTAGVGATNHEVFFGPTPSVQSQGMPGDTSFDPGPLAENTTYYWRVDETNAHGTTQGSLWSFTTGEASTRPRVIVSTDIGGSDPDDFQSMVHYLVYADRFDTEGLVSSPPRGGRASDILDVIDVYEIDYPNLDAHADFPTPQSLRAVTVQGALDPSPSTGFSVPSQGSNWIIDRAHDNDDRPLWILVWGSITDVAQAVHDDPTIKDSIRVYSIGSWNTGQDDAARNYLYNNHADMWWIESDTTFRGMYVGGNQAGDLGNVSFVAQHVLGHGALGNFFYSKKVDIKMGDTPSVLYLLDGDLDDPTTPSWGGMYRLETVHQPPIWTDRLESQYREANYDGARTVNQHREAYLRDWQQRMDWAASP